LILNAAVWMVMVVFEHWLEMPDVFRFFALTPCEVIPWMAPKNADYLAPGRDIGFPRIWQLFTYMWIHSPSDVYHILFNSLFFWMIGGNLEQAWGARAFLRFYLICGVGAGVCVLVFGLIFAPDVLVVGASGAVYGLVVAWGIYNPNRLIYFFGIFPMKVKHFVLIPIGFALADFLTRAKGVSHAAHLGGMAVGALLVTGFWRPDKISRYAHYWWLRRKLKVIEGNRSKDPPDGGYWH
jgi:membrane associated rhomboid family serine protease